MFVQFVLGGHAVSTHRPCGAHKVAWSLVFTSIAVFLVGSTPSCNPFPENSDPLLLIELPALTLFSIPYA